jgi:hypothetical protein
MQSFKSMDHFLDINFIPNLECLGFDSILLTLNLFARILDLKSLISFIVALNSYLILKLITIFMKGYVFIKDFKNNFII